MSSNVFHSDTKVAAFAEALRPVDEQGLKSIRKSGSTRIRSGLQAMFDKAKADGFAEGHAEGVKQGHAEGHDTFEKTHVEDLLQFRSALEQFVEHAQSGVDQWYVRAEESLSTLAIEIARRAICKELEISRECVVEITQQALAEVRHGTTVRVKVNPFDASILHSRQQQIIEEMAGIRNLEIVPDLNVASGCEVETDGGVIDARIDSYLDRMAKVAA